MIVISGSESFIGKELRTQLDGLGKEWIGIDPSASSDKRSLKGDICDPSVFSLIPKGAEAVVHLAAISRDKDCAADLVNAFSINVSGTINLIQAAKRQGVKQFIFASSEWVYGEVANNEVQCEDTVIDISMLKSEYAITKLVGEQMLRLACSDGALSGTVLRFGIVYGPRPSNWSAVESLFFSSRDKAIIEVGAADTARRFIHVSDICSGILASLGVPKYEIFNLSGDILVTLRDVVKEGAKIFGTTPQLIEKNSGAVSIRNPDNSKIKLRLGWKQGLNLRAGLETLNTHITAA